MTNDALIEMKYTCGRCHKTFEYNVKEYGCYDSSTLKSLCNNCKQEFLDIKRRHSKELNQWWQNG